MRLDFDSFGDGQRILKLNAKVSDSTVHLGMPQADKIVEDAARMTNYWYLSDLIENCDFEPGRCYQAAMRLIGHNVPWTDMHGVIDYPSRVALNA